ncbi:uncharacterized protein LOC132279636 isoform X1 [Cornus florida]|uniref:uncharacterized protein LOC132279636 isoform X1 n=1 Tax=Cornus florida TaxID=4283 RepID=UPI00289CB9EE|nr:uncharacterized protein LOC132279636 isoform X1 [Cornus florida]
MWSGGRILQTDTGSVLMEAIGYIKFLQNQVETLPIYKVIMQQDEQNNARALEGGWNWGAKARSHMPTALPGAIVLLVREEVFDRPQRFSAST